MNIGNRLRHIRIRMKTLLFMAWDWCREHREIVTYVIFGGLTTLVDWAISFSLYNTGMNPHVIHLIAWVAAVLFAFVTNKIWVFRSKRNGLSAVLAELFAFAGGRVLSYGVQELLVVITVDWMQLAPALVKIPISVLVVIINYILGKLVFHKKKKPVSVGESQADSARSTARVVGGSVVIGASSEESGVADAKDETEREENTHETEL